jgi:hypothetical protein
MLPLMISLFAIPTVGTAYALANKSILLPVLFKKLLHDIPKTKLVHYQPGVYDDPIPFAAYLPFLLPVPQPKVPGEFPHRSLTEFLPRFDYYVGIEREQVNLFWLRSTLNDQSQERIDKKNDSYAKLLSKNIENSLRFTRFLIIEDKSLAITGNLLISNFKKLAPPGLKNCTVQSLPKVHAFAKSATEANALVEKIGLQKIEQFFSQVKGKVIVTRNKVFFVVWECKDLLMLDSTRQDLFFYRDFAIETKPGFAEVFEADKRKAEAWLESYERMIGL